MKFLVTVIVGAISGNLAYALGWTQEITAALVSWHLATPNLRAIVVSVYERKKGEIE